MITILFYNKILPSASQYFVSESTARAIYLDPFRLMTNGPTIRNINYVNTAGSKSTWTRHHAFGTTGIGFKGGMSDLQLIKKLSDEKDSYTDFLSYNCKLCKPSSDLPHTSSLQASCSAHE